MRASRRYQRDVVNPGRPVSPDAEDFQHLMECVESDCWYCNDEPEPKSEVTRFIEALSRGEGLQLPIAA